MTRKTHLVTVAMTAILAVSIVGTTPVLAQNSTAFVCDGGGLESILSSVTTLIVTVAALVAVIGGAGFTLASAARPTEGDYQKKRNQTVIYGGSTLLVLYGANAITSQIAESLDFSCILPFF
jgi:hypothetical protein